MDEKFCVTCGFWTAKFSTEGQCIRFHHEAVSEASAKTCPEYMPARKSLTHDEGVGSEHQSPPSLR